MFSFISLHHPHRNSIQKAILYRRNVLTLVLKISDIQILIRLRFMANLINIYLKIKIKCLNTIHFLNNVYFTQCTLPLVGKTPPPPPKKNKITKKNNQKESKKVTFFRRSGSQVLYYIFMGIYRIWIIRGITKTINSIFYQGGGRYSAEIILFLRDSTGSE